MSVMHQELPVPIEELLRLGTVRRILRWGTAVLHTRTRPVVDFGPELQLLLADLLVTNEAAGGAGLAAPQIGVGLAAFVYDCPDDSWQRRIGVVCNPTLTVAQGAERRLVEDHEGCLSLPGAHIATSRPDLAVCGGQDQYGSLVQVVGTGVLARCLQHETDHLEGRVFADRLPRRSRRELIARHERVADAYPDDWPVSPRLD